MKKSLLACLLIALMFVMNCFAMAGDVETDIAGHTYKVNLGGMVYEIRFVQGPYGPGPCGKADLMVDGGVLATYDFYAKGDLVIMTDFANFYYREWQLIWIQGELLVLNEGGVGGTGD